MEYIEIIQRLALVCELNVRLPFSRSVIACCDTLANKENLFLNSNLPAAGRTRFSILQI